MASEVILGYNLHQQKKPPYLHQQIGGIFREVYPMNTSDYNATPISTKLCFRDKNCAHPRGPILPISEFYRDSNRPDGLRSECKACHGETAGVPYMVPVDVPSGYKYCARGIGCVSDGGPILPIECFGPDKTKKSGLCGSCRRCRLLQKSQWANKNREYFIEYNQKNADEINAKRREYKKANPDKEKAKRSRREAKKKSLPSTFTDKDWRRALEYFDGRCVYCGNGPSLFDYYLGLHQEHHIPIAKDGGYTPENIVPACQSCNLSKNDKEPTEWLIKRFGVKKAKAIQVKLGVYFNSVKDRH